MMNNDRTFWNSRGLADLAKKRFLVETSIEDKLDFIALLETGIDNFVGKRSMQFQKNSYAHARSI